MPHFCTLIAEIVNILIFFVVSNIDADGHPSARSRLFARASCQECQFDIFEALGVNSHVVESWVRF